MRPLRMYFELYSRHGSPQQLKAAEDEIVNEFRVKH
jgi:hypothetical protein